MYTKHDSLTNRTFYFSFLFFRPQIVLCFLVRLVDLYAYIWIGIGKKTTQRRNKKNENSTLNGKKKHFGRKKTHWSGVNLLQSLTLSLTSIRMSKIFAAFCLFASSFGFLTKNQQRRISGIASLSRIFYAHLTICVFSSSHFGVGR